MKDWTEEQVPPPSWHKLVKTSDEAEPVLTPHLRKYYLHNLKRALEENISLSDSKNKTDIIACTLKLEREALQKCMLTSLYEKAMWELISDIKRKTRRKTPYFDENHNIEEDSSLVSETECKMPISLPAPFLTPPADYPHSTSDFDGPLFDDIKTRIKMQTSDSFTNLKDFELSAQDVESGNNTGPTYKNIYENSMNSVFDGSPTFKPFKVQPSCQSYDWIEEEMARVCGEGSANKNTQEVRPLPMTVTSTKVKKGLGGPKPNTTLFPLPCMNRESSEGTVSVEQPRENWRLIRIKNEAELEERLKSIERIGGVVKRAKLERRFIELFGTDLEKKEHDEVVAMTVKHLMPYYKKHKISSRELFKKVAKHISNSLKEKSLLPDENEVLKAVQGFFHNDRSITSEADIS